MDLFMESDIAVIDFTSPIFTQTHLKKYIKSIYKILLMSKRHQIFTFLLSNLYSNMIQNSFQNLLSYAKLIQLSNN